ncbi:FAD-dependent oxidoreductase [Nocardia sp. NPDC003482]
MSSVIIIAGAGVGGLALAQGLLRHGIEAVVYERDAALDSRRQGYRLHLDAAARDALHRVLPAGPAALFDATAGTPAARFTLLDNTFRVLFAQESEGPAYAVDRLTLRSVLLSGIEDRVRFGRAVAGFRMDDDGVTVDLADGTTARGDVLVGADGINSVVRRRYLPHARVVETGVWQIYGRIPLTAETRNLFDDTMFGVFTMITGPDGTFLGVAPVEFPENPASAAARLTPTGRPLPPATDYMTCSFGARAEWFGPTRDRLLTLPGPDLHAIVATAVRDWHPRARALVAACAPDSLFALPLRTSVPTPPWPTTRTTLLGDAIHAMTPASGSGACTALRDAATLTQALTTTDPLDAVRAYERRMIDYGFAAVRAGAADGKRFLGQDPLPAGV